MRLIAVDFLHFESLAAALTRLDSHSCTSLESRQPLSTLKAAKRLPATVGHTPR
jgi:hypothetical protein